jgi:hypothetical protein
MRHAPLILVLRVQYNANHTTTSPQHLVEFGVWCFGKFGRVKNALSVLYSFVLQRSRPTGFSDGCEAMVIWQPPPLHKTVVQLCISLGL